MAGVFSGHLLNTFANTPAQPIITSGAMSFDARMHGTPFTPNSPFGFTPLSEDSTSARQIATLQAKLNKKLGPEYISQRPGPGGGPKLTYAEGWKIINLANEVFGFNGWSSSVVSIATDFVDHIEESKRFNVGVTAIVRVTLRDGAYHEDVGYGLLENAKSKAAALDKCKKEAITDALKRTLRNFGNLLGNCLYDKSYAQEVVKIKVPPAKLDKNELYRRPEFEETVPGALPPARPTDPQPSTRREEPRVKTEQENLAPETPITYVPRHLRQEMASAAERAQAQTPARAAPLPGAPPHARLTTMTPASGSSAIGANRGPPPVDAPIPNGLVTPVQTPMQAQRPPPPRAPPPRAVATSPLARMRSAPEPSSSFTEPMPVDVPVGVEPTDTTGDAGQDNDRVTDDDDGFPLSTQDGVFFATVDLGDGDLGRPIDFDEGAGASFVNVVDTSILGQEPQPQRQVRDRIVSGPSAGSTSVGPSLASMRNEPQVQPAKPPAGSGVQGQQRSRHVPLNGNASASTSGTPNARTGTPAQDIKRLATSSISGFHLPHDTKPSAQKHVPKPVPACVRTNSTTPQNGTTNALKRSADAMQTGSVPSTSARPPIQGMGLAQGQQQHQRDATARRLSDNSEGNDPKRFKR